MLLPGSKGWINKYFDLVEKNQIHLNCDLPLEVDKKAFIHAALGRTGIIFGFPSRLHFAKPSRSILINFYLWSNVCIETVDHNEEEVIFVFR